MSSRWRAVALIVLLAAGAVGAGLVLPHDPSGLRELLTPAGPAAPAVFVAAAAVLTVVLFPGTVLAAVAGLMFGTVAGAGLVLAGQTLGALGAFLLARSALRPWVARRTGSGRLAPIVARLERGGILSIAAVRSAPGVPATGLHYALGASGVRQRNFVVGIALGAAPRAIMYAAVGGVLAGPMTAASVATMAAPGLLIAMATLLGWLLRRRLAATPAA